MRNSLSVYIKMGVKNVCLDVCLSNGMWRVNENPNPFTNLNEILHTHTHLSKEGFGAGLTPALSTHLGLGDLRLFKLKNTFLKTVHKTKYVQLAAN